MKPLARSVSLHPYFRVRPGKMDQVKALLHEFVARTKSEPKMLYYEFTLSDDIVFCREAYVGAQGVLDHLTNVGPLLDTMLTLSEIIRLEVHGPSEDLDTLKPSLGPLNPSWFRYECGA